MHCQARRVLQVFTESTHIVAIKPSGNVYCWEAIQELNIKPRFMQASSALLAVNLPLH